MAEYTIQVIKGDSAGVSKTFSGGDIVIGRDPNSDLPINDPKVSRAHARLTYNGRDVVLHDLQSSNGTMVNGRRVDNAVLSNGDTIAVGDSELTFREAAGSSDFGGDAGAGVGAGAGTPPPPPPPPSGGMPSWAFGAIGAVVLSIIIGARVLLLGRRLGADRAGVAVLGRDGHWNWRSVRGRRIYLRS